jgi:serine/threonine protein kinase/predicted ATPase
VGAQERRAEHGRKDDPDFQLSDASRLKIVRRLGAGGMGVVYEALDLDRNVRVALKTLPETNPQTLYRFKHEFRALAQIIHPRLVPLYELVADKEEQGEERWFFTMELIEDGVSLLSWIRGVAARSSSELIAKTTRTQAVEDVTPLDAQPTVPARYLSDLQRGSGVRPIEDVQAGASAPPDYPRLRAAFAQVAEGVYALHGTGRLHRDLKPENVFVRSGSGQVVLLDFGLVAALEAPRTGGGVVSSPPDPRAFGGLAEQAREGRSQNADLSTQAGSIAGTVAYMAPEQALGRTLSTASDWYAVGVMLYQALTGRLPIEGEDVEIILGKQFSTPVPPSARVPETPPDLDALCMELLRTHPLDRPDGRDIVLRLGGMVDEAIAHDAGASSLFVGRAEHVAALQRAFDLSANGTVIARVHGRSGAGKSALLGSFLEQVASRPDTLVLAGRCYEQELIPFKAVDSLMDALTHSLVQCPKETLAALLPPDAPLLARVFPVLGRVIRSDEAVADGDDPKAVRKRAFVAVRELLSRLSRRLRVVLFIDDLQWGDLDSIALLGELTRGPGGPPLLLVVTHRSENSDSNACLRAMNDVAKLACPPERRIELDVAALGHDDARELARMLLGDSSTPEALDWVMQQASGSAFLIHELVRRVSQGAAPAATERLELDEILWQRVLGLPEPARKLLTMVAVAGRPVRLPFAQRAADLSQLDPRVVSALRAERLARTDGAGVTTQIETFHDRVRESILAHTPRADIARYSGALAHELEMASDADPETLAVLFEQADELGRASSCYAAAVPRAVAVFAFERAELLAKKAIELARSDEEIALAYEAAIHFYTDMARFGDAYAITRQGASALGIELPAKLVPPVFIADFMTSQVKLLGRPIASLLDLPVMPEGRMRLGVRLANAGAKAAFQIRPELCVAVCTKIVLLCLEHGNSPDCAIGYMVFGAIFQGGIMGRYAAGYELGKLALALVDKYQNERQRAEVSFVVGYFGTSWLRPVAEAEALWRTALKAGQASGDLFHMGCAAAGRMMSWQMRGAPLDVIEREAHGLSELLAQNGQRESLAVVAAVRQAARDLSGATQARGSWQDERYDEGAAMQAWSSFGARHFAHYCYLARAQSLYWAGRLDEASATLRSAKQLAAESKGMLHSAEQLFLEVLVGAALSERGGRLERVRARVTLTPAVLKLESWAKRCPQNFRHKAQLARAQLHHLSGRQREAIAGYGAAAKSADEHGYAQVAALAHLFAARTHARQANATERDACLQRARESFQRWGASALATQSNLLDLAL